MNKETPYPPELIEAAEKEYPVKNSKLIGKGGHLVPYDENEYLREAFLKGLSLAMPLVEALEQLAYQYKAVLKRDFEQIGTTVEHELKIGYLPTYQKALDALANFPKPVTN